MCRRLLAVIIACFVSIAAIAQMEPTYSVPDYTEIEKLTKDKSSAFYYENLMSRYLAQDTTLNLRDYRMLYYGYFFQPNYIPFHSSRQTDSMKMLLSGREQLNDDEWRQLISLGKRNLQNNPFDLKGINIVWVAHRHVGDSAVARLYFDQLKKLVQTILSSGDGLSENTAYHVSSVSHEYDILNILGYEFAGNQVLTDSKCDYLSVKTNEDNIGGLYFDVKQIFKGYEKNQMAAMGE